MARGLAILRTRLPLAIIAGAFLWSAATLLNQRAEEYPPGTITLRLAHWQLEPGVREAFDTLAEEYRKLHPNVKIVQDAIPESVYGQWVSTQLMGGTAPDMIEIGKGLLYPVWVSYYNRYFIPLTRYVNQPNPYNEGTELEGVPLRKTFKDGMRASYVNEIQEFYNVPLSQFGVRIFYNKDLLKRLTGLDEAPTEYRAFLDVCQQIASQQDASGHYYIANVGSKFHMQLWEPLMFDPLTYPVLRRADFNRDATVGNDETYVAFRTGRVDFHFPPIEARFKMQREITDYFQPGFTGLTRDEAVFLFAQQRAVFMATGSWDARSLEQQAQGRFEVGVMRFPWPKADDPYYGAILEGPVYELPIVGFPFAITNTCPHPDVALDFLLFLAGKKQNERLNRIIGWIPTIVGAQADPLLQAFEPNLEGVYTCAIFNLGGETYVKWLQVYSLYQVNQISYDEFIAAFAPFYRERGLKDFLEVQKDWQRGIHTNEQLLAAMRAQALAASGEAAESEWVKYRSMTALRQIRPDIDHAYQLRLVERGAAPESKGPYEYKPDVLARVRRRLMKKMGNRPD